MLFTYISILNDMTEYNQSAKDSNTLYIIRDSSGGISDASTVYLGEKLLAESSTSSGVRSISVQGNRLSISPSTGIGNVTLSFDETGLATQAVVDGVSARVTLIEGKPAMGITSANIAEWSAEKSRAMAAESGLSERVEDTERDITNLSSTVDGLYDDLQELYDKPAMGITSTQIANWQNEVGAKAQIAAETTNRTAADTLITGRIATLEANQPIALTTAEIEAICTY